MIAVMSVVAATAARAEIYRLGGREIRFPTFQLAVLFAVTFGGCVPGLVSVLLSAIAAEGFIEPIGRFHVTRWQDLAGVIVFVAVNLLVVATFELVRRGVDRPTAWRAPGSSDRLAFDPDGPLLRVPADEWLSLRRILAQLRSPRFLRVLGAPVLMLCTFGFWGTATRAAEHFFDDQTALLPVLALALAPLVIILGLGILPLGTEDRSCRSNISKGSASSDNK